MKSLTKTTYPPYQKWINAVVCGIVIFVCLGFCSSNKSLYLSAITSALGFKRTAYSVATSCRFLTTAIVNLFFGISIKKFGTKKLILAGVLLLMASMYLNTIATTVPMFCISECIAGIGFSWSSTGMVGTVINRWFKKNTGTITGTVLAANGIGGALAAQIVTPIIYNPENVFGYRDAYRLVMVILLVTFVVIALFFKENKQADPEASVPKKKSRSEHWVGIGFDAAKKKAFFYGAIVCIFLTGMCIQGINGITAAHLLDVGISTTLVSSVTSITNLMLTGSKLLTGVMYDRLGLRKTMNICTLCGCASMIFLGLVTNSHFGIILAFLHTPLAAISIPLETVMLPLYANDLFGEKSYNKVMGLVISANTLGYAVGTPVANICFDMFGTYTPILFITGFIMLAVMISLQFVITSAHKTRKEILAQSI